MTRAIPAGGGAFFSFFATDELLVTTIRKVGLGALLVLIGTTIFGMHVIFRDWRQRQTALLTWESLRRRACPLLAWLACSLVAMSAFPMANRVQMDEIVVLGTSKAIHEEREPITPTLLKMVNGIGKLDNGYVDKRPFLFAALVALCHDLLGYSPRNPFYCNMILGCFSLALVGILGARLGRCHLAGVAAMIALSAVPLFCEHVTGGGLDVLNLAMILVVTVLAIHHVDRPTTASAQTLIGAGILLAYARYESLLYAVVPLFAIGLVYRRQNRLLIGWSTPVMLLCLLPLAAIHFLTFSRSDKFFQLAEKGLDDAFSVAYIIPNLGHALYFFLNSEHMLPNSPVVFVVGLVSLIAIVVTGARRWREIAAQGSDQVFWSVAGVIIVAFVLLMAYSWGQLDQPVASRLSLPLYLLFALCISYCCREFASSSRVPVFLAAGLAVSGYWSLFPLAAKQYDRRLYASGQVLERLDEFAQQQPDRHYMVFNGIANFWLTRDVYAIPPVSLESNPAFLRNLLDSGAYRRVYLIQVLERSSPEGRFVLSKNDRTSLLLDTTLLFDDLVTDVRRVRVSLVNPGTVALLDRAIAEREAKAKLATAPQPTVPVATAEGPTQ
jgi:hypothetical protein